MKNYAELAQKILDKGFNGDNRTSVSATRLFGERLEFDMADGFPLMTTKQVPLRWVFEELMWFLRGDTNEHNLRGKGVDIWKEWADTHGNLGPVYGKQMRSLQKIDFLAPVISEQPDYHPTSFFCREEPRITGDVYRDKVYAAWLDMYERCEQDHVETDDRSGACTGKMYFCQEEWMIFKDFELDFRSIPGWESYLESASLSGEGESQYYESDYILDVSHSATNYYCPSTVKFVPVRDHALNSIALGKYLADSEGLQCHTEVNVATWASLRNRQNRCCLSSMPDETHIPILTSSDPLAEMLASLTHNPTSRRLVVDMWNPLESAEMSLEPCHMMFQLDAAEPGKLSLSMYQRSCDTFLGLPFNIASYALLLRLIAHYSGREADRLIMNFGNIHIYGNHYEQLSEQLTREPLPLPSLHINREPTGSILNDILSTTWEDIELLNYKPHGKLSAPVAV